MLHDFIAEGHFSRHLRQLYGERAEVLRDACTRHLAGQLSRLPCTTGVEACA